jgi:hypothetical protein
VALRSGARTLAERRRGRARLELVQDGCCERSKALLLAKSQQKERFLVASMLGMASQNSFSTSC